MADVSRFCRKGKTIASLIKKDEKYYLPASADWLFCTETQESNKRWLLDTRYHNVSPLPCKKEIREGWIL